ncbi:transposase, partial [Nonomuraea sp. 10N515B]|uniref:transposase n=1 Tax=Nonomuraea sp. 10N515B TaxID=3457422 RepID=UPI003FCEB6FE
QPRHAYAADLQRGLPTDGLGRLRSRLHLHIQRRVLHPAQIRQEYNTHVRKYLWSGHFWSRSYYAGSTGDASLATVRTYLQSQEQPQK